MLPLGRIEDAAKQIRPHLFATNDRVCHIPCQGWLPATEAAGELQPGQRACLEKSTVTSEQPTYRVVRLFIENGSILGHEFGAPGSAHGVIWLGSARGGLDSPARDLFDRLATDLTRQGITSLRLRYREPGNLESCVEDALIGIQFLLQNGTRSTVLVGYSQGGAVAIEAGASTPDAVSGVAVVASQSFGTGAADRLSPRPLLIVQGEDDQIVPADCATYIYDRAREPKQLVLIPGADHTFNKHSEELRNVLESFIQSSFRGKQARTA